MRRHEGDEFEGQTGTNSTELAIIRVKVARCVEHRSVNDNRDGNNSALERLETSWDPLRLRILIRNTKKGEESSARRTSCANV